MNERVFMEAVLWNAENVGLASVGAEYRPAAPAPPSGGPRGIRTGSPRLFQAAPSSAPVPRQEVAEVTSCCSRLTSGGLTRW